MNICICGYYGMGNFGDEIFLETFKQIFTEDNVFPWYYKWSAFIDTSKIDAVIIGGGDLIMPYYINENYIPKELMEHKIWVYGVGVVDYYNRENWPEAVIDENRKRISKAKGVYVRDSNSLMLIKELKFNNNAAIVPDIAFAYKELNYPIGRISYKKTIGICVYSYDDFPFINMVALIIKLLERGYHIELIPVISNADNCFEDYTMCKKIKEEIISLKNNADINIFDRCQYIGITYKYIQAMDYIISFKLHPAITAIRALKPVLCISKLKKSYYILKSLGLEDFYTDFDFTFDELYDKVDYLLSYGKERIDKSSNIIKNCEAQSKKALYSLKEDILKELVH